MNNNIFTVHEENYSKIKFENILNNLIHYSEMNLPKPSINLIKKVLVKEIK